MEKKILGQIIKDEVKRQGLKGIDFAELIPCSENHIYKIYKSTSLDTFLLERISKVLNHNFFEDIINGNVDMENPEVIKEFNNRRAVSQFMEIVPEVLEELKRSPIISFGRPIELQKGIQTPDFIITDYWISFTIGETFMERSPVHCNQSCIRYEKIQNKENAEIEVLINEYVLQTRPNSNPIQINIKLDYKTKDEWLKIMKYAFELYDYFQKRYRIRL
ncbi:MAG: hypothetical protein E7080_05160 [Bacteroidales bacterium]|nr:hypothetical protein [Bacteroidales bacterium]